MKRKQGNEIFFSVAEVTEMVSKVCLQSRRDSSHFLFTSVNEPLTPDVETVFDFTQNIFI